VQQNEGKNKRWKVFFPPGEGDNMMGENGDKGGRKRKESECVM